MKLRKFQIKAVFVAMQSFCPSSQDIKISKIDESSADSRIYIEHWPSWKEAKRKGGAILTYIYKPKVSRIAEDV